MVILERNGITYSDDPIIEHMMVAYSCFLFSMVFSLEAIHIHSERKWNNEYAGETPSLWVLASFGYVVSFLALLFWVVTLYWVFFI